MPEAAYQALQQQMGDLSKPLQGGANQKAPLMESLIESVPLMFAGIADTYSGDNTTSQLVGSIMARREKQQQMARENELDLRKFQLMVGLKGFEAELAKLENDRKGLESTANIEQSRAATEASRAATTKYSAEAEEARELRPLKTKKAQQELEAGDLEISNARQMQPLKVKKAQQELEEGKAGQLKLLQEIEQRNVRHAEIKQLMDSTDPALQKQGRYALLFEQPPREQDDDGLGLVTQLFPASRVHATHRTESGNQILSAQSELIEKVGPAAPGSFTVLEAINDLDTAKEVSNEDKTRLYEYAMDELSPSMGLIKGDEVYQRNLNREVIVPLAKITGKKALKVWDDLLKSYNKKVSKEEQIKYLNAGVEKIINKEPEEVKPVVKKKSVLTKETVPDSPLRKLHAILESGQDSKQLADYTTNYNTKKQADVSRRSKQKQDEDEKKRKRLDEYTKQYNAKRRALGLPVG